VGIIFTGDTGEVARGTSMRRIVGTIDGFMKESVRKGVFTTPEINKMPPE
jgi:hypothetical protein